MNPIMDRDLRGRIRHFLTYGDSESVAEVERYANVLLGGVVDGETHAQFKDRAARRLADLLCLFPNSVFTRVIASLPEAL